jgi:type VI secretion system protein VasD
MLFSIAVNSFRVAREPAVTPNQRRFEVHGSQIEDSCGSDVPEFIPDLQRRVWLGLIAAMGLSGCAKVGELIGKKPPEATPGQPRPVDVKPLELDLVVQVSAKVNPDSRQRPSPILVRLYELKGATAFNNADFIALFQRDEALLGGDLLVRDEYVLQPSERHALKRPLNAQTRFLAVFAAYRDLERAHWRALLPVEGKRPWQVTIMVDELALKMVPAA